jgi:hypothetical protein
MITNTMQKATEATNFSGLHTDTNSVNFLIDGSFNQAPAGMAIAAPSIPPTPRKPALRGTEK